MADTTRRMQDSSDATLENFFSRPIKISEAEWATSITLGYDFDPWSLYFENPRVSNRLSNYKLLRCKLHLKFVINGNGFQYGRSIASYLPYESLDDMSTNTALIPEDLVGTSQLPHVFLDPTTSNGGEMVLPFFYHLNYLDIPTSSWDQMGRIYVRSLNTLKHANGATDLATISVFAWAEDVSMSVLTSREPSTMINQSGIEFEAQSGEIDEANSRGTVSGPATTVANWTAHLTTVPYIAPFAIATTMIANTVAGVAKLFGYSRPPITKNPDPYRPSPISSLALTTVPDTAQKLSLDDKQELTIDPRISGLDGVDPMNIREIAKRESYLTSFTWAIGTTPETMLWNSRVTPVTWAESGTPKAFHFPACAFAALPFEFWTGTMRFRFQVVCSTFHKGRLKIAYDPDYFASNEYNVNYLKIVDIAEEQDFTVEVGIGQDRSLINHAKPGYALASEVYGTTPFATIGPANGVLAVYIVNELTTPNSLTNNDIEVNVFVSMGDDFEVFVPDDHFQNFTFAAQMGEEVDNFETQSAIVPDAQDTAEPSAPLQSDADKVGMPVCMDPQLNKVFTGEAISSFRTLLKRYNLHTTIWCPPLNTVQGRMPLFPYLRGNVAGAVDVTGAFASYNYCNTVMLHWVRYAFSGWRGSIRYKFLSRRAGSVNDNMYLQRTPAIRFADAYGYSLISENLSTSQSSHRADIVYDTDIFGVPGTRSTLSGPLGQTYMNYQVNPNLEVELPYYSEYRFTPGKEIDLTSSIGLSSGGFDFMLESQVNNSKGTSRDVHVAAGEDFQVYFFTGLPRMYFDTVPLAS